MSNGWLTLPNDLVLVPQVVSAELLADSGIHTVSTVQVSHPTFLPQGTFEYQHATGDSLNQAFTRGFEAFTAGDLPVFVDALEGRPRECTFLEMTIPSKDAGTPDLHRRAVLGPPAHYAAVNEETEEHPFCHCCLFNASGVAFKSMIDSVLPYGIRLYVMREESGHVGADCRVNGEDCPAGVEPLVTYGSSWPGSGFEFRKQYVFIHTLPAGPGGA